MRPLCEALEAFEEDFRRSSADIGEVRRAFDEANMPMKAVSRDFLGKLCDISFDAVERAEEGVCAPAFTFRQQGWRKAFQLIEQTLNACFGQIDSPL